VSFGAGVSSCATHSDAPAEQHNVTSEIAISFLTVALPTMAGRLQTPFRARMEKLVQRHANVQPASCV